MSCCFTDRRPTMYALRVAPSAPRPPVGEDEELRFAMAAAGRAKPLLASFERSQRERPPTVGTLGFQVVPSEPVVHGRGAQSQLFGDLLDGQFSPDERLETFTLDAATWRVAVTPVGFERVFPDPVADRRGVALLQCTDLDQRQPLLQIPLQTIPVHPRIVPFRSDGNTNICSYQFGITFVISAPRIGGVRSAPPAPPAACAAPPAGPRRSPPRPRSAAPPRSSRAAGS